MSRLLAIPFFFYIVACELQEPGCISKFDYEHSMLYKMLKIEEEVKAFRIVVDEMKSRQRQTEDEQRNKLETALEIFVNSTEKHLMSTSEESERLLQEMRGSLNDFNGTIATLKKNAAIGFTVKSPKASPTAGQISFNTVVTSEGDGFDKSTGIFTCSVPGTYYFSLSLLKHYSHTSNAHCYIYKNDVSLVIAYVQPGHSPEQGFYAAVNSVFVRLVTGDKITVRDCTALSSLYEYSSFSGFLVRAN